MVYRVGEDVDVYREGSGKERKRGVNDGDGLSNPLKPTVISVAIIN